MSRRARVSHLNEVVDEALTWLFVPGDRPDRFQKASDSGASIVVVDLEDAVAEDRKVEARDHAATFLAHHPEACVRINGASTRWHDADLEAVGGQDRIVMVPKAEDPSSLDAIARRLGAGAVLVALVETASGILGCAALARHPRVGRLAFGSHDLATQLGVSPTDWMALLRARSELVLAAAAAGLAPPIDGVTVAVRDSETLANDVTAALALGLTAKLCVHPDQIDAVTRLLGVTSEQVAWAARVVEASRLAGGGAVLVDGEMVDRPVVERAERILRHGVTDS